MQGNDHMAAAQPDFIAQAEGQWCALMNTALEIGCPTLIEAAEMVYKAIAALDKQRRLDRAE